MRVYEPCSNQGWGYNNWRKMLQDLWQCRELVWNLFRRNLRAQHRGTLFGNFGLLVEPIVLVSPFLIMVFSGVLDPGSIDTPYPVYATLGLAVFYVFRDAVPLLGNALIANQSLIVKINFPKEVLIFALLGQVVFSFAVRVSLAALFVVYFVLLEEQTITWSILFFPLAILPIFILSLGVGFVLSCLTALLRDVTKYVSMSMPFILFTSPVIYSTPRLPLFEVVTRYNPIAGLVEGPRDLVVYGRITDPVQYWIAVAIAVSLFLFGWRTFRIANVRLAERLGSK